MPDKITPQVLRAMKKRGEPIAALTAYDCPTADHLDAAGADVLLVGDSLGMVVLGFETTLPVTLEHMIHHTAAVARRRRHAMVVADMPWLTFHTGPRDTILNAGRLVKETGCDAVKLEGGVRIAETLRALVDAQFAVMGHVGLTPQSVLALGGYRVQGKTASAAERVLADARACEEAGCFAVVLEGLPSALGRTVTQALSIPTIGIGAGVDCDGQILVTHDMLGLYGDMTPKFVKRYADVGAVMREAAGAYIREVRERAFPGAAHTYD